MPTPHKQQDLGNPLRTKKKRGAVFIVIVASIAVHVLGLGALGVIKIVETIAAPPEFEAPPVEAIKPPPPPPPPPPSTKRTQRSLPRPQPLAAQNPQNMSVPAINLQDSDLSLAGGRGFGGGLGDLGGGAMESLRLTSFGFDRALENTLEGALFDLKRDERGDPLSGNVRSWFYDSVTRFKKKDYERKFYQAEKKMYASYLIVPNVAASAGPKVFGVEDTVKPNYMVVYYQGDYKPAKSGRFRFLGLGDNILLVKLNGKIVLDGSLKGNAATSVYSNWSLSGRAAREEPLPAYFSLTPRGRTHRGEWFDLREGYAVDLEIIIGESSGGLTGAYLLIEEDRSDEGPKIFSTRPLSVQDKEYLKKSHPHATKFLP